jgi:hypothetical protein
MIRRHLLLVPALILFVPAVFAQESQSLGDIARKIKAQKNGAQSTSPSRSSAPAGSTARPAADAAGSGGPQQTASSPVADPPATNSAIVPDLNPDVASDIHGLEKYQAAIVQLFQQEKFDEIERIANEARSTNARFPGGFWKIHAVYAGLRGPVLGNKVNDAAWPQLLARVENWKNKYPNSITARVTLAFYYNTYGWAARGGGYADSVSEEGWRLLAERSEMGRKVLEEAQSLPTKCPEWFLAMMEIARAQDWDDDTKTALFEQAVAFNPEYYYYYQEFADMKLPKWGGEEGDVAAFAAAMADRIGGKKGDLLYYQIATSIICACDNNQGGYGLSWPRIQHGYAVMEEMYGSSIYQLNKIALIASMAGQPEYAKALFARIGENWDVEIWHTHDYFAKTKRWADDLIAKRYVIEALANAKTPEGVSFTTVLSTALDNKYHKKLIDCMQTAPGYDRPDVGVLLQLAKDGSVQKVILAPDSAPKECFAPQLEKAFLSPPPRDNYWAIVNMSVRK